MSTMRDLVQIKVNAVLRNPDLTNDQREYILLKLTEWEQNMHSSTKALTPGQQVWVRYKKPMEYRAVGEIISLPTPSGTIMLRRVPGDATTLAEIPLEQIEGKVDRELRYVAYATVAGSGSFPVDMLRYDSCVPVNFTLEEDDLGRVKAVPDPASQLTGNLWIARAVSYRSDVPWTTARWSSFLWGVKHQQTAPIIG